jgi:thioredoxin 2
MIRTCPDCHTENRVPASKLHLAARCGHCKTPLSPVDQPVVIESEADFDDLVRNATLPVLVDFWAQWCGPCRTVAPELEKIARSRAGKLVIAKVDTDAQPTVAARYQIKSIPTFVLFANGRESKRALGAMPGPALLGALGL